MSSSKLFFFTKLTPDSPEDKLTVYPTVCGIAIKMVVHKYSTKEKVHLLNIISIWLKIETGFIPKDATGLQGLVTGNNGVFSLESLRRIM